jgi:hypothetical protein
MTFMVLRIMPKSLLKLYNISLHSENVVIRPFR